MKTSEVTVDSVRHEGCPCYKTNKGEFGMDKQSLADACKVNKESINYIMKHVGNKVFAPWLAPFIDSDIILTRQQLTRGHPTVILKWEFCSAVMAYYQDKQAKIKEEIPVSLTTYQGYDCYQTESGDIGVSKQSLADACNVHTSMIDQLVKHTISKPTRCLVWLHPFIGTDVVLTKVWLNGGMPKLILKWDFCSAAIDYRNKAALSCEKELDWGPDVGLEIIDY